MSEEGDPSRFLDEEIDQDGDLRRRHKKSLHDRGQFYVDSILVSNEERAKRDFFYAVFFNYKQCGMDESLGDMIKTVETVYLGDDEDSLFIKESFDMVLKGDAENSHYKTLKLFLTCVLAGRDKSIKKSLDSLCRTDAKKYDSPSHELEASIRLLDYLPNRVDSLTKTPWNLKNIDVLVKHFVSDSVYVFYNVL